MEEHKEEYEHWTEDEDEDEDMEDEEEDEISLNQEGRVRELQTLKEFQVEETEFGPEESSMLL